MSGLQLRCKVFPLAFLLYLFKPRFSIDGSPEQVCSWGENSIPLAPGRHSLRVWYKYITGPTNVADAVIDVPPEGLRMVYKTRWIIFLPGLLEPVGPAAGGPQHYGQQAQPGYGQQPQQPYGQQQPAYGQQPQQPQQAQQPYGQNPSGPYPGAGGAPSGGFPAGGGPSGGAPAVAPTPQPSQAPPAGWNPDPSGRHQHRYWDGSQWTSSVADNGVTTDDPL